MILWIDRVLQKLIREYRKAVFRKKIHLPHKKFSLVGNVIAINPNVTIGKNVVIYPDVMFFGDGPITIGDNVSIGNGTIFGSLSKDGITVGDNTMIAAQCYLIDCDHGMELGMPMCQQKQNTSPISIGNDVWLAANATVLKGSHIADGEGLVKGEIPPNSIAVGVPAKVIKERK